MRVQLRAFAAIGSCFSVASGIKLSLSEDESQSPVQRVVKLLNDMKAQLEDEATKDKEIADKLDCWCTTNTKEKEQAIKDGDAKTDELTALITESAAKKATQDVTIKQSKKELAKLRLALEQATSIREKETAEYRATETEMVKTVTNLQNAIAVLKKHQSLAQMDARLRAGVETVIHAAAEKHLETFGKKLPTVDDVKAEKKSFLQASTSTESKAEAVFLQAATSNEFAPVLSENTAGRLIASFVDTSAAPHLGPYAPQSGGIFGILTSMLDNFKSTMSDATQQEADAQKAFVSLKKASNEQIAATEDALAQAKSSYADASKVLSDSKEELEKTRDVRSADVEFLRNLKLQCNDIDAQWEARQKERMSETVAVSEAITVLTSDDNRETLAKTAFVQVSMMKSNQERAIAVLKKASMSSPSWDDLSFQWAGEKKPSVVMQNIKPKEDLALLAAKAQLDAFTKVKKAMDDMTAQIKSQMSEDVKHRDFCSEEFSTNSKNSVKKTHESEDLSSKIEDLAGQIAQLIADIATAEKEIADTQESIKKAGEDRETENALFQQEVAEQRATQVVLQKALDKLNSYYAKDSLLQVAAGHKQAPPVAFEPYRESSGASPVLALIGKIVEDSKDIEKEAMADENSAQANYETFVADANNSIKSLQDEIASNTESKANKKAEKVSTETAKSDAEKELEMLANYKADLHASCDFVMKNFELRQSAMSNEIEAIAEAKAILSGMK